MSFDPNDPYPALPSTPASHPSFTSLQTAAQSAAKYFAPRPSVTFVIAQSPKPSQWFVFPLSQRSLFAGSDPRSAPRVVFAGTYSDLVAIALAFPPDLFPLLPPTPDLPL